MSNEKSGKEYFRRRIVQLFGERIIDENILKSKSFNQLLEEINIYHQELEHQNEELKRIQDELDESKKHYIDLFESAPVGYVIIDDETIIQNANKTFSLLIGLTVDDLKGRRLTDFITPESQNQFYLHHRRVFKQEFSPSVVVDINTSKGVNQILIDSNTFTNVDKTFARCTITNITKEKELQQNLTERMKEIECLYNILKLSNNAEISTIAFLEEVVELLPAAFQYPNRVGARIEIEGFYFASNGFNNFGLNIKEKIKVENIEKGEIAVAFSENCEGNFLNEEIDLIKSVSNIISQFIEKREAHKKLEKNERYYRTILQSLHEDIIVINAHYQIVDVNNSFVTTTGYTREELIGKKCFDVSFGNKIPCELANGECQIKEVFSTGRASTCTHQLNDKNGNTQYLDIILSPIIDEKGIVTHVVETARNITNLVENQKLIAESEEKYRLLITEMYQGMALHEVIRNEEGMVIDYRFLDVNNSFLRHTGLMREQVIGKNVLDILPETESYWLERFGKVATTGKPDHFEEYSRELGKYYYVDAYSPKPNQFAVIISDVTENRKYEEKLKASDRIFNYALDLFCIANFDGYFITVNPSWEKTLGWTIDELLTKPWKDFVHPSDREKSQKMISKIVDGKNVLQFENRYLCKDGSYKWLSWNTYSYPSEKVMYGVARDITEKKANEKALLESENNLIEAQQIAKLGRWEHNIVTNQLFWSDTVFEIFELDKSRFNPTLELFLNSIHPDDRPEVEKTYYHSQENRIPYEIEHRLLMPDGRLKWVVEKCRIDFDRSGNPLRSVGIIQDITNRKSVELALRESEEKFHTLFQHLSVGVSLINREMKVLQVNPQIEEWFPKSDFSSNPYCFCAFSNPNQNFICDDCPVILTFRDGKTYEYEKQRSTPNGVMYFRVVSTPIFNHKGEVEAAVEMMDNITERKRNEEILKTQKEFLEILMQTIPNPVFYKDIDGKYLGCNNAFEKFVGMTKEEIFGKTVFDISPTNLSSIYHQKDLEIIETGDEQHYEFIIERKDGERRNVIFDKAPILDQRGRPSGIIGIITDITERKKAEEEIKHNAERFKSLVRIFEYKADNTQLLLDFALDEALKLTDSSIGYIYHYNDRTKEFNLSSWSKDVMSQCAIANPLTCYELDKTGIWGEVVRQRKEIIVNDFEAKNQLKKGYPSGHAPLKRFMSIPITIDNIIVAVVGVANKVGEYNETDLNQLQLLMNSVWGIVQRKQDSDKISKLSVAVEQSSASVVITDTNGIIEYVNPKFSEITGFSFDEAIGENPRVLNSGFHDKEFYAVLWNTILAGREWKGQLVNKKKNGDLYWESASISPVKDDYGEITNFIAIKDDITDLKMAEDALRESELKLRRMIKQSPDGIMLTNEKGVVVAWNRALEVITSVPSTKAIGTYITEFHKFLPFLRTSNFSMDNLQKVVNDLLAFGHSSRFTLNKIIEVKLFVDNEIRYLQLMVFVIPGEKGNMLASFVRDSTLQKIAEIAVKEREEKLQAIFDNSIQSFVIFNSNLIVQSFNYVAKERAKYFFGTDFEIGKSIFEVYPQNLIQQIKAASLRVFEGEVSRIEISQSDSVDNKFWFELHFSPVYDDRRNIVGIFFNSIDITQRKLAEESMARALEREKELSELKSRFVSTVSHEFRTPLASIFSNAQLLHRYLSKWDEEKRNLSFKRIFESVNMMTSMLENVSLIGKEQSGRFSFRPEIINLNDFAKQIVEESQLTLNETNRVNLTISHDFSKVLLDQILLRHILINVISNAIKYSPGKPSVDFTIQKSKRFIEFIVEDSGVGIPTKELDKIFDPFFRASNSDEFPGTGLGMSIVKQCVSTHGGTISIQSELGVGTKVSILIPMREM
jgi:PAS domain S-box-containing protein